MPEPLKNRYDKSFISTLSTEVKKEYKPFNTNAFTSSIFNSPWKDEELKQRMRHITNSLHKYLPNNYKQALNILKPVSPKFSGFEAMIFPDFVECFGLKHFNESITALETFTQYSSSEFAVRPFIIKHEAKMMAQMKKWSQSKNHHIRRLASEGCRPRLPWAMALPKYKNNPEPVLNILTSLLDDNSEYVRRSVANNLNDISKDHPDVILNITKQYIGQTETTDKLLKHACRTLLKQGNRNALLLFGYSKPTSMKIEKFTTQTSVKIGNSLEFTFTLYTSKKLLGKTRVEYAIGFLKANGKLSNKVFKITESTYKSNSKAITKKHSFKLISTRKYYHGIHRLLIIINGQVMAEGNFTLLPQ